MEARETIGPDGQQLTHWPICPNCGRVPDGDERVKLGAAGAMSERWLKTHLSSCTLRGGEREPEVKVSKAPKAPKSRKPRARKSPPNLKKVAARVMAETVFDFVEDLLKGNR